MNLKEIAKKLGIESYPESLEQAVPVAICDEDRIRALQEEFDFFGDFYEEVLQEVKALAEDPARRAWGEAVAGYALHTTIRDVKTTPFPLPQGEVGMLPLLIHLPMVPSAIENYRSRGFSEEVLRKLMHSYKGCMQGVYNQLGKRGLDQRYYRWLFLYSKALIFPHYGFLVEVASFHDRAVILKNRENGTLMPLLRQETLHRSGLVLGAAGCEDPEGSRTVEFRETEDGFYGYPVIDGKPADAEEFFPKETWCYGMQPGDIALSVHLPKAMDISPANVDEAFGSVVEIARKWYPEYDVRGLYCGSWLLDPSLADILGPESKIVQYGNRFVRYPVMSAGREVFSFVFPPNITDLNELPENTRLERGLKKLYLSGGYIHAFYGVIL